MGYNWYSNMKDLADRVTYDFVGVKNLKLFQTSVNGTVTIAINNPSAGSVTINKINGVLLYNGNVIGQYTSTGPLELRAGTQTVVSFDFIASGLSSALAIYQYLTNKDRNLTFAGRARVGGLIETPYKVRYI